MFESLLSGQLFLAALFLGSVYAMIAIGLNLVYGTMRLLNVAHGDLVMVGAFLGFFGYTLLGLSPFATMFVSAILGAAIGYLIYVSMISGMLNRMDEKQLESNSLLVFFGLSVVLQNTVSLFFSTEARAYQYLNETIDIYNVSISQARLIILLVGLTICGAAIAILQRSGLGLSIKAIIQNRSAAEIVGINVASIQKLAFIVGFSLTAFCGSLISMTIQAQPFIGFTYTISAFLVIILGGLGNVMGGIIAGFFLAAIEIYGTAVVSQNARSILIYGLFVLVLTFRPNGLLARVER